VKNPPHSHGTGEFDLSQFASLGHDVIFEPGVLVFHPENIEIQDNVYIGHYTILKGYYQNKMIIGPGTWIGQQCFFHSAGGIEIGHDVGIGPGVKIITSSHKLEKRELPILHHPVQFAPVMIRDNSDIGVGAIILPGVTIGVGAQIGAGCVVTKSVDDYAVVAGVPARVLYYRRES
jgi:acetyltransferase-like isoleucine patch superfamily enzyme